MELLDNKRKCGLYLLALICLFALLGVSYTGSRHFHYTYGYEFNSQAICEQLNTSSICSSANVTNTDACMEAIQDQELCKTIVDAWAKAFNEKCEEHITSYAECNPSRDCWSIYRSIIECEKDVTRPEWLPLPPINEGKI